MNSVEEVAWAAGLFEGEGCFYHVPNGRSVQVSLTMTDEDVVKRFHEVVGVGVVRIYDDKKNPDWKVQYRWRACGWKKFEKIATMFRPYLGQRRLDKMDEIIDSKPTDLGRWPKKENV